MKFKYFIGSVFIILLISSICSAQSYSFHYNARGHRDLRNVISLKSATIPTDSLSAKELNKPLEDQIGLQKTLIYPNPTKGLLRIDLPVLTNQEAMIRVFDSGGKLVIQKTAVESNNEVNLSDYPSGFYIMTIQIGNNNRKEWKIIKE